MENFKGVLFLKIQTEPLSKDFKTLSPLGKLAWEKKAQSFSNISLQESYQSKSALYPQFGKISHLSFGMITSKQKLRIKTFSNENEKIILEKFSNFLDENSSKVKLLCGHNSKDFDFPFLYKRMIINKVNLPKILQINHLKPWKTPLLDTIDFWKFGSKKSYISLEAFCYALDLTFPENQSNKAFLNEELLLCICNVYLSLKGSEPITRE